VPVTSSMAHGKANSYKVDESSAIVKARRCHRLHRRMVEVLGQAKAIDSYNKANPSSVSVAAVRFIELRQ